MALLSDYTAGTVTSSGNVITGTGTAWSVAEFREGDIFTADGWNVIIASVDSDTQLTVDPNRGVVGAALSGAEYGLRYMSDGSRASAQARQLIDMLGNSGTLEGLSTLSGTPNTFIMFTGPGSAVLVPKSDLISGIDYDVQVDTLADRALYDGQPEGFSVLVSDVGDGRSAFYSRVGGLGGWTDPAYITGPSITLDVTDVDEVPYGTPPDVTLTSRPGGYDMAFEIPRGMIIEPGTTTTLPPDQPAAVTFVPIVGGYRLDLALPKGETGDINGLTPFWQIRVTTDADVATARAGLGVGDVATVSDAETAPADPSVGWRRTAGYAAAGDGGDGLYTQVASPAILTFQDINGDYWELQDNEILPEQAGAVSGDNAAGAVNNAAFQRAANSGRTLKLPKKSYYVDPGVTFEFGGIKGQKERSKLYCTGTGSEHFFTVDSVESAVFEDIFFTPAAGMAKTAGSAIMLTCTTGTESNNRSRISGNIFAGFPIGLQTGNAQDYTVFDNYFSNSDVGMLVQNDVNPDGGDSRVTNNMFVTQRASTNLIGILQRNSGGLKVVGNKFLYGNSGYTLSAAGGSLAPTQSTSILIVNSNSFEHQVNGAIALTRSPSAAAEIAFYHAIVTSNMFNGGEGAPNILTIGADLNLKWFVFDSNSVQLGDLGGTGLSIAVLDQGIISGNIFDTGGSGVGTGIVTGVNVYATIGMNRYGPSLGTKFTIANPTNTTVVGDG